MQNRTFSQVMQSAQKNNGNYQKKIYQEIKNAKVEEKSTKLSCSFTSTTQTNSWWHSWLLLSWERRAVLVNNFKETNLLIHTTRLCKVWISLWVETTLMSIIHWWSNSVSSADTKWHHRKNISNSKEWREQ